MNTFNTKLTALAAALEPVEGAYDSTIPRHRALRFLSESQATGRDELLSDIDNANFTLYYTSEIARVYERFPYDVDEAIADGCENVGEAARLVLYNRTRNEVTELLDTWETDGLLPSDNDDEGEE